MLLASHSADLCKALCNKALLLSTGSRIFFDDIDEGTPVSRLCFDRTCGKDRLTSRQLI
jgi:hypothetical protein